MLKADINNILEENQVTLFDAENDMEISDAAIKFLVTTQDANLLIKLCLPLLDEDKFRKLAIAAFVKNMNSVPEICVNENVMNTIDRFLEKIILLDIDETEVVRIAIALEKLWAFGNKSYALQIIQLYKKVDTGCIDIYNANIVRARLAILAYGANQYNADKNLCELYTIYNMAVKGKFKYLKGMIFYYHYIFYSRTNYSKRYILNKRKYEYEESKTLCLRKAREHEFHLAKCHIE